MTFDNWASVVRQVMVIYPWAWLPFVSFVLASSFIIVNLIIAVICDAISALEVEDKAKLHGLSREAEEEVAIGGRRIRSNDDSDSDSYSHSHSDDSSSSDVVGVKVEGHLHSLEGQMEELARIQAQTVHALQYLTRQTELVQQTRKQGLNQKPLDGSKQATKPGC